jgi:hypothetical protein
LAVQTPAAAGALAGAMRTFIPQAGLVGGAAHEEDAQRIALPAPGLRAFDLLEDEMNGADHLFLNARDGLPPP